jgi:thiol:disulfide interchange protein DsbD
MGMQMQFKAFLALIFFSLIIASSASANENQHFTMKAMPSARKVSKGDIFKVKFIVNMEKTWYTYSLKYQVGPQGIGPTQTEVTVEPADMVETAGDIIAPEPKVKHDKAFEMDIQYYKGKIEFVIPLKAKKDLDFSEDKINVVFYAQQCDPQRCLPPDEYKVRVSADPYAAAEKIEEETQEKDVAETTDETESPEITEEPTKTDTAAAKVTTTDDKPEDRAKSTAVRTESQSEIDEKKGEGVFSFLWFAMSAGALALLTPCVFPMVPITVSFFTKRAEKNKGRGLRDSLVYALGIITTFTALGFVLALVFGATGIQDFATNPWINLLIAAIFVIFALNLFGAFEIQVPTSIMNKLNAKSQSGSGLTSVLLMGLTFSLTSFTCTVPFVGSALLSAAGGEWFYPIIGMLGFSAVFAAPFFLLALFPSGMSALPKAGGWMNNVKVVMGFLEIAAAIKFISNADLVWSWGIMPREMFLAIWIGAGFMITLYVLGTFRLSNDTPVERVGSLRVIFAIFFASISFYLLSGLFGERLGELDAFLPPPDYEQIMGGGEAASAVIMGATPTKENDAHEAWFSNYEEALAEARKQNRALFIDFTGFTCTNCRWMEQNMFHKPNIENLLDEMIKVKLFTDRRGEPYESNKQFQKDRFNSIELPLYVIMTPEEEVLGTKTFTRDIGEFKEFMNKGLLE